MNTTETRRLSAPQPLTVASRLGAAFAVAAVLVLTTMGASRASHEAVQNASDCIAKGPMVVKFERVDVVVRRDVAPKSI